VAVEILRLPQFVDSRLRGGANVLSLTLSVTPSMHLRRVYGSEYRIGRICHEVVVTSYTGFLLARHIKTTNTAVKVAKTRSELEPSTF
jgi:hypothetical protein